MSDQFLRTKMLIGDLALSKLKNSHIAIFGLGGVGSYAAEALARANVGTLTIVDHDKVDITNLNRQLIALNSTVGKLKCQVMKARIEDINKDVKVIDLPIFFDSKSKDNIDFKKFDYVLDAIDTVMSKILIIECARQENVPILSCMGAGNRLYPSFIVEQIENTKNCPLARVMRSALKKRGISGVKVIYSKDDAVKPTIDIESKNKRHTLGSMPYVPPVMGMMAAGEVILDLIGR